MSREIIWLPEAERTFNDNIEYLSEKWTVRVINDFLDRVDEAIAHIVENLYIYASHGNREDIRKKDLKTLIL